MQPNQILVPIVIIAGVIGIPIIYILARIEGHAVDIMRDNSTMIRLLNEILRKVGP